MNVDRLRRAAVIGLVFATGWTANGWRLSAKFEAAERAWAEQAAETSRRVAQAEHNARLEEGRRKSAMQEIVHAASIAQEHVQTDRRAADDAHQRMLDAARAYAASGPAEDPAPSQGGETAAGPGLVFTDVLAELDDTAGDLAQAYDRARIAGLACERAYDALTAGREAPGQVSP
jgi:hypothetical protein